MSNITSLPQTNQHNLHPNIRMAERFLTLISQCDEPIFSFQIFADKKTESHVKPKILCGSFEQHQEFLIQENQQGAGVFVTINKTDGKGRKTENITDFFCSANATSHHRIQPQTISCILDC